MECGRLGLPLRRLVMVASPRVLSRATNTIRAPIFASRCAVTSPMPEVPPVITTTLPRIGLLLLRLTVATRQTPSLEEYKYNAKSHNLHFDATLTQRRSRNIFLARQERGIRRQQCRYRARYGWGERASPRRGGPLAPARFTNRYHPSIESTAPPSRSQRSAPLAQNDCPSSRTVSTPPDSANESAGRSSTDERRGSTRAAQGLRCPRIPDRPSPGKFDSA